ncbi:MAG TPA: MFS transporter, partial [Burkholderiaceae bacterium]|nr:MFS transporter [Burkholderiaceae bacterium]
ARSTHKRDAHKSQSRPMKFLRLPNLLATKYGRLTAFFLLYVTEGIPLGFAATAVATQLRRQNVGPAEIGAFVGSFYLPWAFKWAFGPVIDVFASDRLGRRRGWIIGTQVMMAATLLSTMLLTLPQQLGLFTIVLLVHNTFGAMQDVAIDALAVNTLQEQERGLANGLMFGGASIGQLVGGSGVLFLTSVTGFQSTFVFVAGSILLVTVFVVLPMKEAAGAPRPSVVGSRWHSASREMRDFAVNSFRSFVGSRGAFVGLLVALLPAGAMGLGLALQSNLAVELGMNDDEVAWLNVWSTIINGGFCVLGGWLSDRLGRRVTLSLYIAGMSLPVLYLMNELSRYGWIMPVEVTAANRPTVAPALLMAFWIATLVYNAFNGLMYGTRAAIFMDVTNPAVAATQFTAYMALLNLTISYSAMWQGIAIEAWGYPKTLLVDAIFGVACVALIPFMRRRAGAKGSWTDEASGTRARAVAVVLGLACAAWVPYSMWHDALGAAQPIAGTLFTLVFVGSALFLLAGAAVIGAAAPRLTRAALWLAPLLLAMHARYQLDTIAGWFASVAPAAQVKSAFGIAFDLIALAAALALLLFARQSWQGLDGDSNGGAGAVSPSDTGAVSAAA